VVLAFRRQKPVFPGCQQIVSTTASWLILHNRNYNVPLEGLRSGLPKTHPSVLAAANHGCGVHGELVNAAGVEPARDTWHILSV